MKNIKYMLFAMLFLLLNMFYVNASCTEEELSNLKSETEKIKITYKHLGKIEKEDEIFYNVFEVKVKNIDNDMYVSLLGGTKTLTPVNNEILENFNNGTWLFDIYSNKCNSKLDTIKVFIPRFNEYSLDPLCNGIDSDDFPLCGKYYEYDVSYRNFKERVTQYRNTHVIKDKDKTDDNKGIKDYIKYIIDYLLKSQIYVIISLTILLLILIMIVIFNRRKKRGVLQ